MEVDPQSLLRAVAEAIGLLGRAVKQVDSVALSVMSPAWVAMDAKGKPLTPIITHQDRRSVEVAIELENASARSGFCKSPATARCPAESA